MECKICGKMATRSAKDGVYCEKHYWENADGSSVAEQVEARHYEIKGNYD